MTGLEQKIYIEGTDCCGKDTVGGVIAGKYGITNVQKLALHGDNPWNTDRTHELPSGHPLIPAYLMRSVLWDITHFDPARAGKQLQISFTAARSAAWCQAAKDYGPRDVFAELLRFTPVFENAFLLGACVEVKQERLKRRTADGGQASQIDRLVFQNPDFVMEMDLALSDLVSREMGAEVVNTDNLNIEQVAGILVASIDGKSVSLSNAGVRLTQMDITPELSRFHQEIVNLAELTAVKFGVPETAIEKLKQPL